MSTDDKYCIRLEKCECGDGVVTLPDLSYEEQYAGYHDENGDKVYFKVIDLGAIIYGNKDVPHGIANFKNPVNVVARRGGLFGNQKELYFYLNRDYVTVQCYNNPYVGNHVRAIIYYTCTDR